MSRRTRRNYSPVFKAKVVLAAIRGEKTMSELAEQFDVHANQISILREQLLQGAYKVFDSAEKSEVAAPAIDVKSLHAKIGQLALEHDFLSVALDRAGLLPGTRNLQRRSGKPIYLDGVKRHAEDGRHRHPHGRQRRVAGQRVRRAALRTIKYEEVYLRAYASVSEARASLGRYLDFYDTGRPHSSLDRQTLDEEYFNPLQPIPVSAQPRRKSTYPNPGTCSDKPSHF